MGRGRLDDPSSRGTASASERLCERCRSNHPEAVVPESEAVLSSQLDSSSLFSVVYGELGALAGGRASRCDRGESAMIADGTIGDVKTTSVRETGNDEDGVN